MTPSALEPREVSPTAWVRWVKDGGRLGRRVGWSLLPLTVGVGMVGGWGIEKTNGLLLVPMMALSGLWQAWILGVAERGAQGTRVEAGTGMGEVLAFWALPGRQAWQQVKSRGVLGLCLLLGLIFFLAALNYLFSSLSQPPAVTPSPAQWWNQMQSFSRQWGLFFLWSWSFQLGGGVSMCNMLVRRFDLSWVAAKRLNDRCSQKNHLCMTSFFMVYMAGVFAFIALPVLIFAVEAFWVCCLTVAAREIYEGKDSLAPLEARVLRSSPRVAHGNG